MAQQQGWVSSREVTSHSAQGRAVRAVNPGGTRSVGLAVLYSLLVWPGMGHMYNRHFKSGVMWMLSAVGVWLVAHLTVGFFIAPVIYVLSALYAYRAARRTNEQVVVSSQRG